VVAQRISCKAGITGSPAFAGDDSKRVVGAARGLEQDRERQRAPNQAQPERKEAGAGTEGVDERIVEGRDQGGHEEAEQADARYEAPAPHRSHSLGFVMLLAGETNTIGAVAPIDASAGSCLTQTEPPASAVGLGQTRHHMTAGDP
jgi:hypothetical protein